MPHNKISSTKPSLWQVFKQNFGKIFEKKKLKTNEQIKKEHDQMKRKILKERELARNQRIHKYSDSNLREHKRTIYKLLLYFCYLVIFVLVVISQLDTFESYQANYIKENIKSINFKLSDEYYSSSSDRDSRNLQAEESYIMRELELDFDSVDETSLINQWVNTVLLPLLYADSKRVIFNQNYCIGDPQVILGVRKTKFYENDDHLTKEVFPRYINQNIVTIYDKLEDEAETSPIELSDGTKVYYTHEGSGSSLDDLGGYIVGYDRNKSVAFKFNYFNETALITNNWVNIYLVFLYGNRNLQNYVTNVIHFENIPSGEVKGIYDVHTIKDYYSTPADFARLVFEIVVVIIASYFLYLLLKAISFRFLLNVAKSLNNQTEEMRGNNLFFRLINFNSNAAQQKE